MDKSTVLAWLAAVLPDAAGATAAAVAEVSPIYNTTTGWAFNTLAPTNSVRSMRMDKLIADANAINPQIAAHIPFKVMGRFWLPPDPQKGFGTPDPARFAGPTPEQQSAMNASNDQIHAIILNLEKQQNTNFGFFMENVTDTPNVGYRGEAGVQGFSVYVPTETVQWTAQGKQTITRSPTEQALVEHPVPLAHIYANGALTDELDPSTGLYDPWFDLQTDLNVAHFWASWLARFGVNVTVS